jgi:DNA-binding PadR family transcriptional regulator
MILIAILRVGEHAYGVPIARELEETGRRSVLLGAVYAALDRMEKQGLVSSSLGEPTAQRGGKAKRFFAVTSKGVRAVKDTQRALTALWTGVPALKGGTR